MYIWLALLSVFGFKDFGPLCVPGRGDAILVALGPGRIQVEEVLDPSQLIGSKGLAYWHNSVCGTGADFDWSKNRMIKRNGKKLEQ